VSKGLTDEQVNLMERESANLEREFKIAEQSYGTDHLDLVLVKTVVVGLRKFNYHFLQTRGVVVREIESYGIEFFVVDNFPGKWRANHSPDQLSDVGILSVS